MARRKVWNARIAWYGVHFWRSYGDSRVNVLSLRISLDDDPVREVRVNLDRAERQRLRAVLDEAEKHLLED